MGAKKGRQNGKASNAEDSDGSESEEEELYKVEKIIATKTVGGKKMFFVKWENYPEKDATWEPEENMVDCDDLIEEFLSRPKGSSARTKSESGTSKKRASSTDDTLPDFKKVRKDSKQNETPAEADVGSKGEATDDEDVDELVYLNVDELPEDVRNLPSWDGLVELEHMEKNPDEEEDLASGRNPIVFVVWVGGGDSIVGKRSKHETKALLDKCPKTLVKYLTNHIKFRVRT
ncbi:Chromobox protein 1 [Gonapodya sp. JEL0774]|nr:Chromobox protein 1 [Gonapodya sp. JEL0774]